MAKYVREWIRTRNFVAEAASELLSAITEQIKKLKLQIIPGT